MVWSTQKTTQGKYVLEGVVDENYAVNVDTKKLLLDFMFILFRINKSWKKLKLVIFLSTSQARCISLVERVKQLRQLIGMLGELEIF